MPPMHSVSNDLTYKIPFLRWAMLAQLSHSSESSGSEDDYLEEEAEEERYLCLFCEMVLSSCTQLTEHSLKSHKLDLVSAFSGISFYGTIKTINYTRSSHCGVEEFREVLKKSDTLEDKYLKPILSDDSLLMIDFEELAHSSSTQSCSKNGVQESDPRIELLQRKLEKIQQAYLELLESKNNFSEQKSTTDDYFESYADYSIHAEMLQDKVRTEAYRDYIYKNTNIFNNKTVLDVGCGTGILSMFCAEGGAASVVAVDNSKIVEKARKFVKCNNLSDKVEVIEGKVEEVKLDRKFDILISEWMGYGLLFECMLDSVISARDKYLRPGGLVVPNRTSMFIAAVSDEKGYETRFNFWNNVYGFDMSEVIPDLFKEAVVKCVDKSHVISDHCGFKHLDLSTVKTADLEFSSPFQLQIGTPSKLTAFVIHFSCYFDGEVSVVLDTSPECEPTHWLQTVLYLKSPVLVSEGSLVQGNVTFTKSSAVKRGYIIKLDGSISQDNEELGKFCQQYYLH
ncbi:hypothetical protein ACHWQZ_G014644 [Mnemiopsis leidyi]